MSSKLLTPLLSAVAALALAALGAGCNPNANTPYANKDFNFFGLYEIRPNSYARIPPYYPTISSDEMGGDHNYGGTQIKLLSGLLVYKDY